MDVFDRWDPDWQMLDQLIEDICDESTDDELLDLWEAQDWEGVKGHLCEYYELELTSEEG